MLWDIAAVLAMTSCLFGGAAIMAVGFVGIVAYVVYRVARAHEAAQPAWKRERK